MKEIKNLKKKEQNLKMPAKLHALIKNSAPECIKLTSNIKDLMLDDLELGLQLCPIIITEHIYKVDTISSNECPSCCTSFKYICKCCPERV